MAGLQTIVDYCNGMTINRRKVVGIQITRNEIPRLSTTPTKNPWKFQLDMPSSFRYSDARQLMEALDTLDRTGYQDISFSNNACLNWIFRYQGSLSQSQLAGMTIQSFNGDQLVLTNLPAVSGTRVLFESNDLIQINGFPYPFTSTTQVLRGGSSIVTVTTHRPNIITGGSATVAGRSLIVGNACQFRLFCPNMPVYKLLPGGAKYAAGGTLINNALIEWSDAFELYEYVGTS